MNCNNKHYKKVTLNNECLVYSNYGETHGSVITICEDEIVLSINCDKIQLNDELRIQFVVYIDYKKCKHVVDIIAKIYRINDSTITCKIVNEAEIYDIITDIKVQDYIKIISRGEQYIIY